MSDIPTEILLPSPRSDYDRDLGNAINEYIRVLSEALIDNISVPSGGGIYFGDSETNGSWRIVRSGDDLVVQRRESGTWNEKSAFMP